ncbi:alpha-mannosidase [Clostridia bacterium]|nr:alpha-mannosidase [Clostridia bacterium]
MKYTLCIVPHTHWDREWYLPHARHNYRLIKLMDTLIETLENDPDFKTFHLDGQVVLIEDYLRTRPRAEGRIKKLIADGRIKIGPFYILQDEFLVSGEANIRNFLIGLKVCARYGKPSTVGYFPDAFGNVSQIPQIMRGFGADCVFFGRGIIPTGYANEVLGKSDEGFSEIVWEGADKSAVLAVQFVNWYHNAFQLPEDETAATARINDIVERAAAAARTPYLLGMNGCDHQPVQTNLSSILKKVRGKINADVVHTDLESYVEKIRPYQKSFYTFRGEITGQNGNGYHTLIDTASSRIYLKRLNHRCQHLLENSLEPLSCILASLGGAYDGEMLYGFYKHLLHNHPHDSICGCGVDEIHRKMVTRFCDVADGAESLRRDVLTDLADRIDTGVGPGKRIVVFNAQSRAAGGLIEGEAIYRDAEPPVSPAFFNSDGTPVPASFTVTAEKAFELPRDRFREVFDCKKLKFSLFVSDVPATGFKVLTIAEGSRAEADVRADARGAENSKIKLAFHGNGTFDLYEKSTGAAFRSLHYFEETGDDGTEYVFRQSGETFTTEKERAEIALVCDGPEKAVYRVTVPLRTRDGVPISVVSLITLSAYSSAIAVETRFENTVKNHRIRAYFPTGLQTEHVYSFGQYDIVRRDVRPGPRWTWPHNPQRTEGMVYLAQKPGTEEEIGLAVGTRGLNEYEVVADRGNDLGITLVRGVGELGDWYYFPTFDSQCLGPVTAEYCVCPFGAATKTEALTAVLDFSKPPLSYAAAEPHGGVPAGGSLLGARSDGLVFMGCLKRAEKGDAYVARFVNLEERPVRLNLNKKAAEINMAETETLSAAKSVFDLEPKKIITLKFKTTNSAVK